MKKLFSLLVLIGVVLFAKAQNNVDVYTANIHTPDSFTGARASVSKDADVTRGLTNTSTSSVVGYRICIFFNNTQNGRTLANGALSRFRKQFSDIPSEVIYANPTFKTMVGYCIDKTEATMMLGQVVNLFPDAFMVREEGIPISKLANYNSLTASPSDSLSVRDTDFKF